MNFHPAAVFNFTKSPFCLVRKPPSSCSDDSPQVAKIHHADTGSEKIHLISIVSFHGKTGGLKATKSLCQLCLYHHSKKKKLSPLNSSPFLIHQGKRNKEKTLHLPTWGPHLKKIKVYTTALIVETEELFKEGVGRGSLELPVVPRERCRVIRPDDALVLEPA